MGVRRAEDDPVMEFRLCGGRRPVRDPDDGVATSELTGFPCWRRGRAPV